MTKEFDCILMDSFDIMRKIYAPAIVNVDITKITCEALRKKQYKTLKLLLSSGINFGESFFGLNPYHILYMHSLAFQCNYERNCGLAETTNILLSHAYSPSISEPGSYPLYSLLYSLSYEFMLGRNINLRHHLTCVKLLLTSGADPNFDEIAKLTAEGKNLATCRTFGRILYNSALFVYCDAIIAKFSDDVTLEITNCIEAILVLLLKRGIDFRKPNVLGDPILHYIVQHIANQTGHMVRFRNILSYLLKYGADPDACCFHNRFAVEYFFFQLVQSDCCVEMKLSECFKNEMNEGIDKGLFNIVIWLFSSMSHVAACQSFHSIRSHLFIYAMEKKPQFALNSEKFAMQLTAYIFQPRKLFHLSKEKVWQLADRKLANIKALSLPSSITYCFTVF